MEFIILIFIPHHSIVAGYYGFTLDVRVSVHPSVIHLISFPDDNLSKHQWIFTKFGICIVVGIWLGIANGQNSSNLMELSACDMPIFSFTDDNFSKCQGILTKLDTCIDKEIWFVIANGQISTVFDRVIRVLCP